MTIQTQIGPQSGEDTTKPIKRVILSIKMYHPMGIP